MLKQTVLNAAHRALDARMVDFGGWDMPVNYGSQIEEHHAVRKDCGMFDVSHMCPVDLVGADCRPFLSRLVANDVAKLTVSGKALYKYLAWMQAKAAEWKMDVIITQRRDGAGNLAIIAVQGPNARAKVWQVLPQVKAASEGLKPFFAAEVDQYFIASTG